MSSHHESESPDSPLTCWIPSLSTSPGGKIRLAKARRKMAENSVSRPPIPMSSNLKLGARIAFVGPLGVSTTPESTALFAHRLDEFLSLMPLEGSLTQMISVPSMMIPTCPSFPSSVDTVRTVALSSWPL